MKKKRPKSKKKRELDKKLQEYKKILKNDHDWDYNYILKLLKYKLERTRKCILSNKIVISAPKMARQIKAVEDFLDRVIKDKYEDELFKPFYKKYGRPKMILGKAEKGSKAIPVTIRYTKETPRNKNKIRKENLRLAKKASQMKKRDLKKSFDLMHKNIWGWWD